MSDNRSLGYPSRRQDVFAQRRGFFFHLVEPVFDHVADRDDAGETAALDHGQMAELALGHALHQARDGFRLVAGHHLAGHHLPDLLLERSRPVRRERAHDVPLGEDSDHLPVRAGEDHRADFAVGEQLDRGGERGGGFDGEDVRSLTRQYGLHCHGTLRCYGRSMYRRREQEASPRTLGAPLELARSVQAPIGVMMRRNRGRRKGRVACLACMLHWNVNGRACGVLAQKPQADEVDRPYLPGRETRCEHPSLRRGSAARRIHARTEPMADSPDPLPPPKPALERTSVEAYGGILAGIIGAIVTAWWAKAILLVVAAVLLVHVAFRSK